MASIIYFKPLRELSAVENMQRFVSFVRDECFCFVGVQWDEISWDLSSYFSNRANPNSRVNMSWRSLATGTKKWGPPLQPFVSDFAKAFITYSHAIRPTQNLPRKRLDPFKAIDVAILENGLEREGLWDSRLFNLAQEVIREKWDPRTAYRTAKELEKIAQFLDENLMVPIRNHWRTSLRRPCDMSWRVSEKASELRQAKMPSPGAMRACAEAFNLASKPQDVLVASTVPLLMSGPNRIGEVLSLPTNAVVEEIFNGRVQFGLRWFPEKDGPKQVKWVLPSFVGTVRKAFDNITRITSEARKMAGWYEENPEMIYLPAGLGHLRRQSILEAEELCLLVGLQGTPRNSARQWCNKRGISYKNNPFQVWLKDVERHVLRELPIGFPWRHQRTKVLYSDALFVVPKHFFHNGSRPSSLVMFEPVSHSHINTSLGGHEKHGKSSIFSRLGLFDEDGSSIAITSHAFRHWLNTIAQRGGLSQLEIALWSGRKSMAENSAYDHMTASELLERAQKVMPAKNEVLAKEPSVLTTSRVAEIVHEEYAGAIHHTEIGICVHDYTLLPCQLHMDCVNCHESVCIKGSVEKTRRILELRDRVEAGLNKVLQDTMSSHYGADRWRSHQQKTLDRLDRLIEILNDPTVPIGTVIQLSSKNEWTPIQQAYSERIASESDMASLFSDDEAKGISEGQLLGLNEKIGKKT